MPRRCALDAARAVLTPSTSSPSLTIMSQTLRRIRRASSSSSSSPSPSASSVSRSESVRSDVRSGKRPPFADIAAHVLTQTRAKQTFGWDWHAWHATLACIPAFASYCAVQYINATYFPEYEARMKAKELAANSAVEELKTSAAREETRRDVERDALEARVAELEARVIKAERERAAKANAQDKADNVTDKA